jgi:hypothetical protein
MNSNELFDCVKINKRYFGYESFDDLIPSKFYFIDDSENSNKTIFEHSFLYTSFKLIGGIELYEAEIGLWSLGCDLINEDGIILKTITPNLYDNGYYEIKVFSKNPPIFLLIEHDENNGDWLTFFSLKKNKLIKIDEEVGVNEIDEVGDKFLILEFLKFEYKISLTSYSWEELIKTHEEIYDEYYHTNNIQDKFNSYLKRGYYPYYKEAGTKYHDRLLTVILQVIDTDMAAIFNVDYEATRQIKKLLSVISNIGPFTPNISKLSRDLALNRISVLKYLDFLFKADILSILNTSNKSDSILSKPEKIYFENTNLLYAFDNIATNSGTVRETFTMNALSKSTSLSMPLKGDFMIDEKYIIEVGGKNKNFDQIKGMPNTLLIKDGIERGGKNIIPMWCLGFLKSN